MAQGNITALERASYHDGVKVYFSPKGYLNRDMNASWTQVWSEFKARELPNTPVLLVCDNVDPQRLRSWREAMACTGTAVVHGEPGFKNVWQAVDRHIGKMFRSFLRGAQEDHLSDEGKKKQFPALDGKRPPCVGDASVRPTVSCAKERAAPSQLLLQWPFGAPGQCGRRLRDR